jgi:thiamine-monophosphate kinase
VVASEKGSALGPGTEFDRIRRIGRQLGPRASQLGNDCAFIRMGDEHLAVSTDSSVEEVHFRLGWIELFEVGWRATAAALSDLAAVGAQPVGVLAAVTIPDAAADTAVVELMDGVGAAAEFAGAKVLGGDLARAPMWVVTVTVIGRTAEPVTRAGAQPGDRLWISGRLGGARAALEAWRRGERPGAEARQRFARPEPRLDAGRWLARHGARAMIDLSDGLAGDVAHVAAASGARLDIELDRLPLADGVSAEAARAKVPASQFAAEGGEDYELLVALPAEFDSADRFLAECGLPLTPVGEVREGSGVRLSLGGRILQLSGFDHFG